MRIIEVPLERLLDLVTGLQFDGIDQVHHFLGELVERLSDGELAQYVEALKLDGYDHNERDEADRHLRRWRSAYCKVPPKKSGQDQAVHRVETSEAIRKIVDSFDYGEDFQT